MTWSLDMYFFFRCVLKKVCFTLNVVSDIASKRILLSVVYLFPTCLESGQIEREKVNEQG